MSDIDLDCDLGDCDCDCDCDCDLCCCCDGCGDDGGCCDKCFDSSSGNSIFCIICIDRTNRNKRPHEHDNSCLYYLCCCCCCDDDHPLRRRPWPQTDMMRKEAENGGSVLQKKDDARHQQQEQEDPTTCRTCHGPNPNKNSDRCPKCSRYSSVSPSPLVPPVPQRFHDPRFQPLDREMYLRYNLRSKDFQ